MTNLGKPTRRPSGRPPAQSHQKSDHIQERILEVATQLFALHGPAKTSLADIAREAGISRGTLFYWFPGKEDLVMAVAMAQVARLGERILKVLGGSTTLYDLRLALTDLIDSLLGQQTRNALHLWVLNEVWNGNAQLGERLQAQYEQWRGTIASILSPHYGTTSYLRAHLVLASLDGLALQSGMGGTRFSGAQFAELVLPATPPTNGA